MELTNDEYMSSTWDVIDSYFNNDKGYQLIRHLIDSYNDFALRKLHDIIDGFNPIEIHHQYMPDLEKFKYFMEVNVTNPILSKPMIHEKDGSTKLMTPNDARTRNFTYAAPLYVDLNIKVKVFNPDDNQYQEESKKLNNVCLGKIPIMVNSKYCVLHNNKFISDECPYDTGGYFVINGNEKAVISQDRIAENKTYVFINNKVSSYSHAAEIRSVQENKFSVPKTTSLKLSSKPNQFGRFIRVNIHHIKHDVPLVVLFRALGLETDEDIVKFICYDPYDPDNEVIMKELVGSIEEGNNIVCKRDAFEFLSRYMNINGYPKEILNNKQARMGILNNILENEFLPHVGTNFKKKALYLGYMVNKLLKCYLGILPYDDRDSYINKRIDTPGILIANLFRQYYGKVVKDMKNMIQKDINNGSWRATNKFINVVNKVNVNKIVKSTIIESGLKYGLATGNWGIKNNKTKQGVAQVLNRMTYNATLSHLRRINTPIEKTGKLVQPRKLHGTQFGIICPAETPEGVSVGLVKNMATLTNITIASNSVSLRELLKETDMIEFSGDNIEIFCKNTKIFVNGDLIGVHTEPNIIYDQVKKWKRSGVIHTCTSVVWNIPRKEIWICTEGGRCVRPLYIVYNGNIQLCPALSRSIKKNAITLNDLVVGSYETKVETSVRGAVIEYLDVEEVNAALIAMKYKDLFKGGKGNSFPARYTHLEMDPSLNMGVLAGSIPFSDHNQAPRNTYQCLWLEEDVLMADGTRKKIKDVENGDMVVTFNNDSLRTSISKVVNHYVRATDKQMYSITTISGREIKATYDHMFMTSNGWQKLEDITNDTLLGIYPYQVHVPHQVVKYAVLDNNGDILYSDSKTLPVYARIIGYLFTNGYILPGSVNFTFESIHDLEKFSCDVASLGFDLTYDLTEIKICFTGGAFVDTLMSLLDNCPEKIPSWIVNGSLLVKREFLSGFQGGCNPILNQVVIEMFKEFGINVHTDIQLVSDDDFIKYYDYIGYRYAQHKTMQMAIYVEYLKADKECPSLTFDAWVKQVYMKGDMMFVPVKSKVAIGSLVISDITVESDDHSFIGGNNFAVHNCAMGKQAIGIYASNFRKRYDTLGHVLNYPMKPLVQTKISKIVNTDKLPCGMNVIVAIATYTGFNQEDSVIMNKSAVDRGMFTSTYYRTYKEQNNKNHSTGEEEYFCKPDVSNTKQMKPFNYNKLEEEGFVKENTVVESGDIIIGKCMPQKNGSIITNKDTSVALKNNEKGIIDRNACNDKYFTNVNGDGYSFAKIRLRSDRIPTIGDKFSSRHGQKGTVGMMYTQEDMPFTQSGITPDIIINPHAIPSRMTIAQLMECIMGKACCGLGTYGDATPFTDVGVEDIAKALETCGLERYGNELLYNSRTGEQMPTAIFIGPTYYQRLKHMTQDKVHSRAANGPVINLTRQPAEGRARDGGLRLGEMEVECNWAHGTMQFLKERFMECSDNYRVFVCKKCGIMANVNPEKGIYSCKPCKNITSFSEIRMPYAAKLLFQEVQTMSIAAKFVV